MIRGSCLCGGVRFELDRAVGPFELCHCNRCRKTTGSAFMAAVGVRRDDFRLGPGPGADPRPTTRRSSNLHLPTDLASVNGAGRRCPIRPTTRSGSRSRPALLEGDPKVRPDKHIFVELRSPWFAITDELPQLDKEALIRLRSAAPTS